MSPVPPPPPQQLSSPAPSSSQSRSPSPSSRSSNDDYVPSPAESVAADDDAYASVKPSPNAAGREEKNTTKQQKKKKKTKKEEKQKHGDFGQQGSRNDGRKKREGDAPSLSPMCTSQVEIAATAVTTEPIGQQQQEQQLCCNAATTTKYPCPSF